MRRCDFVPLTVPNCLAYRAKLARFVSHHAQITSATLRFCPPNRAKLSRLPCQTIPLRITSVRLERGCVPHRQCAKCVSPGLSRLAGQWPGPSRTSAQNECGPVTSPLEPSPPPHPVALFPLFSSTLYRCPGSPALHKKPFEPRREPLTSRRLVASPSLLSRFFGPPSWPGPALLHSPSLSLSLSLSLTLFHSLFFCFFLHPSLFYFFLFDLFYE